MSGQLVSISILKTNIATVLFSTATHCLSSTRRFQLDRVGMKSDSNLMKASLVYMYYMHSGYQTCIFGKNCAYYIQIFMVMLLMMMTKNDNRADFQRVVQVGHVLVQDGNFIKVQRQVHSTHTVTCHVLLHSTTCVTHYTAHYHQSQYSNVVSTSQYTLCLKKRSHLYTLCNVKS